MKIRYKFRFYPNDTQSKELAKVFGSCRYVYNWALDIRSKAWCVKQERIDYHKTSSMLTALKKEKETSWLSEISSVPTQQALRHLQTAFLNFWAKRSRYPFFKKKRNKQSASYTRNAFRWNADTKKLTVSGLGKLKIRWSREFKSYPTTVTITKQPSGKCYISLCLDEDMVKLPKTGKTVGVDVGVSRLATLSNGERVANPHHLGRNLAKLKVLQKCMSRKQKGSHRWQRARVKIARLYEHISNSREDTLHKFTIDLVRRFDIIGIEDLDVRGMMSNCHMSRVVSDVGFGMFRGMVAYKCNMHGKGLKVVDRFFPSSKMCSVCGYIIEKLSLNIREWNCPRCGTCHDRDENAAKNINNAEGHSVKAHGEGVRRIRASAPRRSSLRSANQSRVPTYI